MRFLLRGDFFFRPFGPALLRADLAAGDLEQLQDDREAVRMLSHELEHAQFGRRHLGAELEAVIPDDLGHRQTETKAEFGEVLEADLGPPGEEFRDPRLVRFQERGKVSLTEILAPHFLIEAGADTVGQGLAHRRLLKTCINNTPFLPGRQA
jgi:hypothetical protein